MAKIVVRVERDFPLLSDLSDLFLEAVPVAQGGVLDRDLVIVDRALGVVQQVCDLTGVVHAEADQREDPELRVQGSFFRRETGIFAEQFVETVHEIGT